MTGFFLAPRIAWGTGALEQLSGLGARRALLLVDSRVAARAGERRIVEELAKSETHLEAVLASDGPDLLPEVAAFAERIRSYAPDWIVAVGGGRVIDAAKAARFSAELPPGTPLPSVSPLQELPEPPRSRLVAVPTTSGSGAEASWSSDLVSEDGEPFEIAHRALMPDWALVDPALASGLSADAIVDGGFEALALAAEAYVSAWANPFSDALARDAVLAVVERLPHAVRWSDDPEARDAIHGAATAAGLAASNAQRGLAHAIARALLEPTGLSYGRLLGIALPRVLEFDRPGARERLESLARALRSDDDRGPVPLAARLERLRETTRLPADLVSAGVPRERVTAAEERIVARTLRSPAALANPRVPSAGDVASLLAVIVGGAGR
jgi:alcohol dehydrogenase class IV